MVQNRETIHQKLQHKREFNSYIKNLPEGLEEEARRFIEASQDKQKTSAAEDLYRKDHLLNKQEATAKEQDKFIELVKQKYLSSLAPAGEPVGVIAAQSVGEPSTQMT